MSLPIALSFGLIEVSVRCFFCNKRSLVNKIILYSYIYKMLYMYYIFIMNVYIFIC